MCWYLSGEVKSLLEVRKDKLKEYKQIQEEVKRQSKRRKTRTKAPKTN